MTKEEKPGRFFLVTGRVTLKVGVEVEADDEDEAEQIAEELFGLDVGVVGGDVEFTSLVDVVIDDIDDITEE